MNQNLNLLRQKYCRPGTFTGKRTDHLFPLEEECEQGKALLAKGKCCKFVVEAKLWVEDQQFSSSLRTIRMKRCNRPTFAPAALPYAWPLRSIDDR
jgi:hypothetical protein